MNKELHCKQNTCALLQAKGMENKFDRTDFRHGGRRKAAQRIVEKSERARQSIAAIFGTVILLLILSFQAG